MVFVPMVACVPSLLIYVQKAKVLVGADDIHTARDKKITLGPSGHTSIPTIQDP